MNAKETEQKISVEELLTQGTSVLFHPEGTSMWPLFITATDTATVAPFDAKKARRGDVWVYRRINGPLVIHRIHHVNKTGVFFVGDHQTQIEGPVPPENLLGKMVAFHRKKKDYDVSNAGYRFVFAVWLLLRPARCSIIRIGSRVKHLFH